MLQLHIQLGIFSAALAYCLGLLHVLRSYSVCRIVLELFFRCESAVAIFTSVASPAQAVATGACVPQLYLFIWKKRKLY